MCGVFINYELKLRVESTGGKNHPRLVIFSLLEKKVIAKTIGTWKLIQGKPLTYN